MEIQTKVYSYPEGGIQRVQLVRPEGWEQLMFWRPPGSEGALNCFADIYEKYLVPACPWLFGSMVLFSIPGEETIGFSRDTRYGQVGDDLTAAAAALRDGVIFRKGRPVFKNAEVEAFWRLLERRGCIRIVGGRLPVTTIIPVSNNAGYLTDSCPEARLKVNASFFIMDRFDCATVYDQVGTPFGLCVKDGLVTQPPLFGREALLVRSSGVSVEKADLRTMGLEIGGRLYRHGENCRLYSRPEHRRTPGKPGIKLVIIGCRVAAVSSRRHVEIPASGFVLHTDRGCTAQPGDQVTYRGLEDVLFGIQVGNSILRNGIKTDRFLSRFYNIRKLEPVPFPPSLYPMDFVNARAARMALGADAAGKPMLLWAEGAGKGTNTSGKESCGASLWELAEICSDLGMVNAINLDGGGSAQMLLDNRRSLRISDRAPDGSEAQRPVPLGLLVP